MKPLLALLAATALAALPTFGQDASPAPSAPAPSPSPTAAAQHQAATVMSLTPDEMQTLKDANQKAQQDPTVKAAEAKMHDAMLAARSVMIAKDPSIKPLLDKVQPKGTPFPAGQQAHVTPDEIRKLRASRDTIKDTPEGLAWQKATADYRAAMHAAMIAADPKVAAIFAKLPQRLVGGAPASPSASPSPSPSAAGK